MHKNNYGWFYLGLISLVVILSINYGFLVTCIIIPLGLTALAGLLK